MASLFFAWKNILCPTTYLWDESKKQDFWINPVYLITVATSKQIFKKITFEFKEKQFLSMKWVRHCSCHLYSNSKEPNHCPNISKSTVFTTLNVNNFVYFYTWHCKKSHKIVKTYNYFRNYFPHCFPGFPQMLLIF